MSDARRILYHGDDPLSTPVEVSMNAVSACWFELHRQGGCGSGQIEFSQIFDDRNQYQIGHWISFEKEVGERWYLGRIEERSAVHPAGLRLRLEGMSVELNQIFPGGFGADVDGVNPSLFAATDLFQDDPDRRHENFHRLSSVQDLVKTLIGSALPRSCHVQYLTRRVESPSRPAVVTSLKIRGEESVKTLLKDLAVRAQSAAWGVDERGEFFFLRPRQDVVQTFQVGVDLTSIAEHRDLDLLFNRILMTGDYVYDRIEYSDEIARKSFRWRGNFVEPKSREVFGDRRIRVWMPWVRTQTDAVAFSREFFRVYSQPQSRFVIETSMVDALPRPWLGTIRILKRDGAELAVAFAETIRVLFDHRPRLRMELGPLDPRTLWPEPPYDERWELPTSRQARGGNVSLSELSSGQRFSESESRSESSTETSSLVSIVSSSGSDDSDSEASDASDASEDRSLGLSSEQSSQGRSSDESDPESTLDGLSSEDSEMSVLSEGNSSCSSVPDLSLQTESDQSSDERSPHESSYGPPSSDLFDPESELSLSDD